MTAEQDKTRQVVHCGAAVRLDDVVLEHGIVFVHPELPLFRLHLVIDHEKKIISNYAFELIRPDTPDIKNFAIYVVSPGEDKAGIIVPDTSLVTP